MTHHKPQYTQHEHEAPDSWHRHIVEEEGRPQEEHGAHTNPLFLAVAFLGSFGFVAATILATILYFEVHMTSLRRERIESTVFARQFFDKGGTREQALAQLNDYTFAAEAQARAGQVSVPVETAMQNVVARYSGKH